MSSLQPPRRMADQTRRLRDLLRAEIVSGAWPDGMLPSEDELRATFAAPRAAVRDALNLLQDEGLVTRVRGQGTFVTGGRIQQDMHEMHGVAEAAEGSIWRDRMSTRILEWGDVPAPPPVARALGIDAGTIVLRIDYAALLGDDVLGYATNYLVYPQAEGLRPEMMRVDFYALLRRASVAIGESVFRMDASVADPFDAEILGVAVGDPVLVMEQVINDVSGRPIDVAYVRGNSRNSLWISRVSRDRAESGEV